jgi:hypothetical protein
MQASLRDRIHWITSYMSSGVLVSSKACCFLKINVDGDVQRNLTNSHPLSNGLPAPTKRIVEEETRVIQG